MQKTSISTCNHRVTQTTFTTIYTQYSRTIVYINHVGGKSLGGENLIGEYIGSVPAGLFVHLLT